MTALRWALGALLCLLALAASVHAYGIYADHKLWLGAVTVALLGLMDVGGFLSLARARARLAKEAAGLTLSPPGGALLQARRAALEAIRARNATPNLDVLRDAAHAAESSRAYLGRYFVAVTVLVGLVGTFAGLMETLRNVAPLLQDENVSALQLVAAPLAGLDVTFGASIVAILVTLALSLVQGDLVIAEEGTLALLDDVTVHQLVPELFPAPPHPSEKAAQEVALLRTELAGLVAAMAESASVKIGKVAQEQVENLVREVRGALTGAVTDSAKEVRGGMLELARSVEEKLQPVLAAEAERVGQVRSALTESSDASRKAINDATTTALAEMQKMQTALREALQQAARQVQDGHALIVDATAELGRQFAASTEQARGDTETAFKSLLDAHGERLHGVTEKITTAAERMVDGVQRSEAQAGELQEKLLGEARNQTRLLTVAMGSAAEKTEAAFKSLLDTQAQGIRDAADHVATSAREVIAAMKDGAGNNAQAQEKLLAEMRDQARALLSTVEGTGDKTRDTFEALLTAHAERLQQLTKDVADATVGIAEGMEKTATTVGRLLETAAERTAALQEKTLAELATQTATITASQNDSVTRTDTALTELARSHATHLQAAAETLHAAAQEVVKELSGKVSGVSQALDQALTTTLETQRSMLEETRSHVATLTSTADSAAHSTEDALNKLFAEHAQRLQETTTALLETVGKTVTTSEESLRTAGEQLAQAAQDLKTSAETLAPSVAQLAPELGALSKEVALLAARIDEPDEQNAVIDELNRLGEGVDRLQSLMKISQNGSGGVG